jgi:uncharacterized protein
MAPSPAFGLGAAARAWASLVLAVAAFLFAAPAMAVDFPPLTGRVVDQADLLSPEQEQQLTQRLEALQRASSRQLVVATVPSLQGLPIEDYGYQLGRAWGIGQRGANNGIILLVAPNERKVRIEAGYGLEGIVTDALSSQIVNQQILPHFKANPPDYAGGIMAGADALIRQLQAPPEAAEQAAVAAQQAENQTKAGGRHRNRGGAIGPLIIWGLVLLFVLGPALGAGLAGRRYRGRRGVSTWGPGDHRGSGLGWMLMGMALSNMNRGGGSSWGGGGGGGSSWGGGGGGGFSGGGGSFGGGGASGGW